MQACRNFCYRNLKSNNCVFTSIRQYERRVMPLFYEETVTKQETRRVPSYFREVYPDFIPSYKADYRNRLYEKLQRLDMLKKRTNLDIPEFYVGSILAATVADIASPQRKARFLGICIAREGTCLSSTFTLRNIIDRMGIEICYDLYCPLIQSIEIIKLEKRLDTNLFYLRDALPEYSEFPEDMPAIYLPVGVKVPINPLKVPLKSGRWSRNYSLQGYKGIEVPVLPEKRNILNEKFNYSRRMDKYDTMLEYRLTINEEEQAIIYKHLLPHLPKLNAVCRKVSKNPIEEANMVTRTK